MGFPVGPKWVFFLLFPENDIILDRVFFFHSYFKRGTMEKFHNQ